MENIGSHNKVALKSGRSLINRECKYNKMGYPVSCVLNKCNNGKARTTRNFYYEQIKVKVNKTNERLQVLDTIHSAQMKLYPNPAKTEVNIKAENLGSGIAAVLIYDINGKLFKKVSYNVDNKLEALILLSGMPKGLYIVEIIGLKTKISNRLLIQ
jgi:DNA topoisomerase VI subunit A